MHVDAAGVSCPYGCFAFQLGAFGAVVLLDAQIFDAMPGSPQSSEQLGTAVEERLAPLRMAGSHGEQAALQLQRSAMGSQLLTRQQGPVLPDGGQRTIAAPAVAQGLQARADRFSRCRRRGLQHLPLAEGPALGFRSPGHGRCCLVEIGVWRS